MEELDIWGSKRKQILNLRVSAHISKTHLDHRRIITFLILSGLAEEGG